MKGAIMSKVLLVEDDEVLARMYQTKFQHDGYQTVIAYSGQEGIDFAAKEKPDVILLDIMMPHVDGFQVLKTIKSNPEISKIPIIVLTNLGTSEILIKEAKRLGADDYLIKYQISAKEVVEKVEKYLKKT